MHEETRQLVVFKLGDEHYALGIEQVQEIIRFTQPRSIASQQPSVLGVISLRGKIVPVHDIATLLGVTSEVSDQAKIVIVAADAGTAGLVVDDVEEVLTISHDQLEPVPSSDSTLEAIFEEQLVAA